MLQVARRYMVLFMAIMLLEACSKMPDNAQYIPADAVAVVGVNLRSLSKKIAWNLITGSKLFKEIQRRMPAKNAADAMGGIENAGFDVSNTFYVYTRADTRFEGGNLVAGLLPLSDAAQWEAYIKLVFPQVQILQREGRKEAMLGTGMYVGWTPDLLIIINAATVADAADQGEGQDTAGNSTLILAEMDKAFRVPAANPMVNNKRFATFAAHGYDLSFWLNYGTLVADYTGGMKMEVSGISLSSAAWKDAILTSGFDFKKGKIIGAISYYLPSQVASAAQDFGEVDTDKDMLDRLPKNTLDMLLSMHISPKGVKSLLEQAGLFGITNVALTTQGLDVDYVLDAFTGDMTIQMNDFSLGAENRTDSFMGALVTHKEQKASMTMTYAVKINNKANFDKLLEMTAAGNGLQPYGTGYVMPLTTSDSVYLMKDGQYAVISNKRSYATGILDGSFKSAKMKGHIAKKAYGYPFALCLDIRQLFQDVDPAISSSPRDSAVIAESKKLLDNVSLHGGKYVDSAYKFDLEINFINTDENSILELIDFGMRMNDINSLSTK